MNRRSVLKLISGVPVIAWLGTRESAAQARRQVLRLYSIERKEYFSSEKIIKSDDEWRKLLTDEQFRILRRKDTEQAFTGKYWNTHDSGIYVCAGCNNELFDSQTKFESGTGWPSFWAPVAKENIETETDHSLLMDRTEVHCARCEGHLGHVFDDGPKPTGLRYCINSASLQLHKSGSSKQ